MAEDRMLSDEILLGLINKNSGGGGTNNYNNLENQPQINGTTLSGNKTASDLGLVAAENGKGLSTNDYTDADEAIVGGVTAALTGKQDALTAGDYIAFNGNEISVKRTLDVPLIRYEFISGAYPNMTIKKYVNEVFDSENTYEFTGTAWNRNIDGFFTLYSERAESWTPIWRIALIKDSNEPEHEAGYATSWNVQSTYDFSYSFNSIDVSGQKLIIKSEMDTALSGKQNTLTFDDAPTDGSNNPVKSNGIYDALGLKQNATDNSLETTDKTIVGAINEHEGDVDSLKSGLTNLDNEVNGDATTYPYADVITIPDAVPSNLADCSVKIEPVQDLHGYDHPWVGGAGKNKLPMTLADIKTANTDGTWNGNVYTVNNGTITVNTDSDGNVVGIHVSGIFSALTYFVVSPSINTTALAGCLVNGLPDSETTLLRYRIMTQSSTSVTQDITWNGDAIVDNGDNLRFAIRIADTESSLNATFYPMIRLATETDATFAPYTNECPITGHTEASVQRDGKNLLEDIEDGGIDDYGEESLSFQRCRSNDYIKVCPNTQYTFLADTNQSKTLQYIIRSFKDNNNSYKLSDSTWQTGSYTFITDSDCHYIKIIFGFSDNSNISKSYITNAQLELGSTATPYEPYQGKTYTIALGDTIYGGTVDFDSGVMAVDRAIAEYDGSEDENWNYDGSTQYIYITPTISGKIPADANTKWDAISNYLVAVKFNDLYVNHVEGCGMASSGNIAAHISGVTDITTDIATIRAYLSSNPLQICYELATPTTIQLTPQQIQLLKGQNTLTASTGQISVTVNGVSGAIGQVQEQVNDTDEALAELAAGIAEKLPTAPTTDGAYVLTVTVADGAPTYSWESAT